MDMVGIVRLSVRCFGKSFLAKTYFGMLVSITEVGFLVLNQH